MKKIQKKSLGMVFWTFDLFHKGHKFYIREAKKYAKNLIVIIARDARVLSGKGFLPNDHENIRLKNITIFLEQIGEKNWENFVKKILDASNFSKKKQLGKKLKKILQQKNGNHLAMLGDEKNIFSPIEKYQPEILLFGYDQKVPEEKIFEKFPNILTKRISSFRPDIFKSSILREKMKK